MLKSFSIGLIILVSGFLHGQRISEDVNPRTGLMVSATGVGFFMVGTSMRPIAVRQSMGRAGYSYVRYEMTPSRRRTQLTAFAFGAIFTVGGLVIENIRNKKRRSN